MNEFEWRSLGIQGTLGWKHYDFYSPEPNVIMLRREIN
jgi:hypothetical protein